MRAETDLNWRELDMSDLLPGRWKEVDGIYYPNDANPDTNEEQPSSEQRLRSTRKDQSGYYDWQWYAHQIDDIFGSMTDNPLVIDLGCGDGRFSSHVLNSQPGARVLCVEKNVQDLRSLRSSLDDNQLKNTQFVCCDINQLRGSNLQADLVICSEVLCVANEPQIGYQTIASLLEPETGVALVSNVASESYLIHAMLNNDVPQVIRMLEENIYIDSAQNQKKNEFTVRFFTPQERRRMEEQAGLTCYKTSTGTGATALLLHFLKNNSFNTDDIVELASTPPTNEIPRIVLDWLKISA